MAKFIKQTKECRLRGISSDYCFCEININWTIRQMRWYDQELIDAFQHYGTFLESVMIPGKLELIPWNRATASLFLFIPRNRYGGNAHEKKPCEDQRKSKYIVWTATFAMHGLQAKYWRDLVCVYWLGRLKYCGVIRLVIGRNSVLSRNTSTPCHN